MNITQQPPQLPSAWTPLSDQAAAIFRQAAELALMAPPAWLDELDAAALKTEAGQGLAEDPVMLAATRRINRAGLNHWATANIQSPGQPVAPYLSVDLENNARELARRGLSDQLIVLGRALQNQSWRLWMQVVFALTQDPALIQQVLDRSAQSINDYFDGYLQAVQGVIRSELEARRRDSHIERRELVTEILQGSSLTAAQASARLGYDLSQTHHAALIWSEAASPQLEDLEAAAQILAQSLAADRPFIVLAGSATLWVWCPGQQRPDRRSLEGSLRLQQPNVRIALGSAGPGMDGFRRSHLEALTVQRTLGRLNAPAAVASIEEIRLVALMTQDAKAAKHFVTQTLGPLASAPAPLQKSLSVFLQQGCNITTAAQALHTHRNTLLRRLEKAESLLPRPLAEHRLDVAMALEILAWTQFQA